MDISEGLEGVRVARTRLSHVDGALGVLIVAGSHVEELARESTFEGVCELLLEEKDAKARLARGRHLAHARIPNLLSALTVRDAMEALRAAVATLPEDDPLFLVAAVGVFAAAHARLLAGETPLAPSSQRSHAEDIFALLSGTDSRACARALESYWVTVADHGLNASTFAARVVASTGSDLVSAVTAAIGALKGPLHGGAPGPVLDMLDAMKSPDQVERILSDKLARKERIMGMGHRVYRVRDPRAAALEETLHRLERQGVASSRLAMARHVEHAARSLLREKYPTRALDTNVEFYTAVLLDTIGIPRTHFAAMFAASRVVGWCAHVKEQRLHGRLMRPDAVYVGPVPP